MSRTFDAKEAALLFFGSSDAVEARSTIVKLVSNCVVEAKNGQLRAVRHFNYYQRLTQALNGVFQSGELTAAQMGEFIDLLGEPLGINLHVSRLLAISCVSFLFSSLILTSV